MPGRRGERMWCRDFGRKIVSPLPPQTIACTRRFFVATASSEKHSFKAIMKEELKLDNWHIIKKTEENRNNATNSALFEPSTKSF